MKYLLFILLAAILYCGCNSTSAPVTPPNTSIDSQYLNNISTLFGNGSIIPAGNQNIKASNIVWKDSLGRLDSLVAAFGNDETVLLNFWATWCPPCNEELPDLKAVADSMTKLGVRVIGVSVDQGSDIWDKVKFDVDQFHLPYQIVIDPKAITYKNYRGDGTIPISFIIHRSGYVRYILTGRQTKSTFIQLLTEALK